MHKVKARDFGLRSVSTLAFPRPYTEELVGGFVSAALQEFASYGVGAQNFAKNEGDRLFAYAVSLSLFNGNATFVLNRDGLVVTLLDGQSDQDAELMKELLRRAHKCLTDLDKVAHLMNGFCHAELAEGDGVDAVFRDLATLKAPAKAPEERTERARRRRPSPEPREAPERVRDHGPRRAAHRRRARRVPAVAQPASRA